MIDVASAIDAEAVRVSHSTRVSGGYTDTGLAISGQETSNNIMATIQPVPASMLMDMPEGMREEAMWQLWSRTSVKHDDKITYEGETYRIMKILPRPVDGFTKAILGLLN